jgi:membrane protein implicated in regulation of membrane protease activity
LKFLLVLIPIVIAVIWFLVPVFKKALSDPRMIEQRKRFRSEASEKGLAPHEGWAAVVLITTIACWVISIIALVNANYVAGFVLFVAPLALLIWLGALEQRRYKEQQRR